ncbi:MAG: S1 RNA-binding domain-containing protein, partial [Planctomycetes bacterium]|nr:S1 RNA-binding domain-containing protein [Planctomycetota bacterium]
MNPVEQASSDETTDVTEVTTSSTARKPILIGSQRDAADVQLRPAKPKAVREAAHSAPIVSGGSSETTTEGESPSITSPEPDEPVPVTSEEAPSQTPDELPAGATELEGPLMTEPLTIESVITAEDINKKVEEALGGMSIDQLVEQHEPEKSAEVLEENSRHKATVIKIHRDDVFFTLRGRYQGVASAKQFKKPPKIGSQMDVVITSFNGEDGLYELHIPGASISVADWGDLQTGGVVVVRITGANTGGLECLVNNIRGFIPASQIALYHVDNLSEFINQKMECVVTEANHRRRNLVLSRRAVLERDQEENRRKFLEQLEVGEVCEGIVRKLQDFGAFVELAPGIDGLVHISKLSWDHVKHPSESVEVGQKIKVKIDKVDKQTGKIGLSIRDLMEHPWTNIDQKYSANTVVSGTVSRIAKFGAFVKLEPGIEGLIHISELAHQRIRRVSEAVSVGQSVDVKVLDVD